MGRGVRCVQTQPMQNLRRKREFDCWLCRGGRSPVGARDGAAMGINLVVSTSELRDCGEGVGLHAARG